MTIRVLYFQGCPNHRPAVVLARSIIAELNIKADIDEVAVVSQAHAEQLHFLGSPTVQVNGVDVEPSARNRKNFGMSCRTYNGFGVPPRHMIQTAITMAAVRSHSGQNQKAE